MLEITSSTKGKAVYGDETICEVHRTVADLLITRLIDQPEILAEVMPELNKAYLMGIKLVKVLIDRKLDLPEWAETDMDKAIELRKERIRMTKELHAAGYSI